MHELSLAYSICDTVAAHVNAGQRVRSIVVECGPLCGVVPESLTFGFSIAAESAGLQDAKLELRLLKTTATCPACGNRFEVDSMWATCIQCGHSPLTIEGGRDLRVKEIEIEEKKNV